MYSVCRDLEVEIVKPKEFARRMKLFKKGQLTLSAVTDDEAPSLDRRKGRSVRNKVRTERRKNVKKNARIAKHCSHKEIADAEQSEQGRKRASVATVGDVNISSVDKSTVDASKPSINVEDKVDGGIVTLPNLVEDSNDDEDSDDDTEYTVSHMPWDGEGAAPPCQRALAGDSISHRL